MKLITEYLDTKISDSYKKEEKLKQELLNHIEFNIDIEENAKPFLKDYDEYDFENSIKTVLHILKTDELKTLKNFKIHVRVQSAWSSRNGNSKIMSIYTRLNSDEFYERWIMREKDKWQLFQDPRPIKKDFVDKIDLLSIIEIILKDFYK